MKEFLKKNRKIVYVVCLLLCTIAICGPLFNSKLDVYVDDGIQHIGRAYGTAESMEYNKLFPNVIPSFSNGFGYSWNLFYGALSTYSILFFVSIVKNYIVAYKITVAISLFLSGLFMYKLVYNMVKNYNAAILAAVFYMTFPYHLTDLYTRNALGEFMAFTFLPLIFLGLNNIFYEKKDKYFAFVIGASGLVFTHNLSSLYTILFGFAYVIVNLTKLIDKKVLKEFALSLFIIIMLTSCYTFPLIESQIRCNYMVNTDAMMTTPEQAASHGLNIKQLFVTDNTDGSYTFELGPHIIIMVALSLMAFPLITGRLKEQYILYLISGLLSLWMATKYFPWKYMPGLFTMIQFPWRMMMFAAFFLSIICSINMYAIIKKFNYKDVLIISAISIFYTAIFIPILNISDEPLKDISEFENLGNYSGSAYETVFLGTAHGEYLPKDAYKDRFYIATRDNNIYVLNGKALIENEVKNGLSYSCDIKTYDSDITVFELPFIYYPGYEITLDGIKLTNFISENGFLEFALGPNDSGELKVEYKGSKTMKTSMVTSILGLLFLIFMIYMNKIDEKEDVKEQTSEEILEK